MGLEVFLVPLFGVFVCVCNWLVGRGLFGFFFFSPFEEQEY